MNLNYPDNHGWHGQGNVIWSNICYPEDLSELLVIIENMDVAETEVDEYDVIEYLDRFHTRSRYPIHIFLHP